MPSHIIGGAHAVSFWKVREAGLFYAIGQAAQLFTVFNVCIDEADVLLAVILWVGLAGHRYAYQSGSSIIAECHTHHIARLVRLAAYDLARDLPVPGKPLEQLVIDIGLSSDHKKASSIAR